jgi:hypothetical protein
MDSVIWLQPSAFYAHLATTSSLDSASPARSNRSSQWSGFCFLISLIDQLIDPPPDMVFCWQFHVIWEPALCQTERLFASASADLSAGSLTSYLDRIGTAVGVFIPLILLHQRVLVWEFWLFVVPSFDSYFYFISTFLFPLASLFLLVDSVFMCLGHFKRAFLSAQHPPIGTVPWQSHQNFTEK